MASTCFVPVVFVLRPGLDLPPTKKSAPKPGQDDVIAPGALTPQLSRVELNLTEEPLAGSEENSESTNF